MLTLALSFLSAYFLSFRILESAGTLSGFVFFFEKFGDITVDHTFARAGAGVQFGIFYDLV